MAPRHAKVAIPLPQVNAHFGAGALAFIFRALTIRFNWRTAPVSSGSIFESDDEPPRAAKP